MHNPVTEGDELHVGLCENAIPSKPNASKSGQGPDGRWGKVKGKKAKKKKKSHCYQAHCYQADLSTDET